MRLPGNIEISQNFEYLITLPGFGKILTVVFGIVSLGLGGHSYESHLSLWREEVFLDLISCILAVSFLYLLAQCVSDDLVQHHINRIVDIAFHTISGVLAITCGCLILSSAIIIQTTECKYSQLQAHCQYFDEKLGASVFAIVDGIIYFLTSFFIYKFRTL